MRYLILATDTQSGNTTVYYSSLGWTPNRDHGDRLSQAKAAGKLEQLQGNHSIFARYRDMVTVPA